MKGHYTYRMGKMQAYMFTYDSVHGTSFKSDIYAQDANTLSFAGKKVAVFGQK